MEFGIWSNGFRPKTSAGEAYDEDIREIVLADQLGFRDAYISEHHGEPAHLGRVDTLPTPELVMCKAAGLTRQIRLGAAVKLIHLHHPVDIAVQAAVTDHLLGGDRFIFGFGSGFPLPQFSEERGLPFDDRHARLAESLDLVRACWSREAPFDWDGDHWRGRGIVALPKPLTKDMPMATATDSQATLQMAGQRGYTLLSGFLEPASRLRAKADIYAEAGRVAGRPTPRERIAASRAIYIADSVDQAIEDLRPAVAQEVGVQADRGFLTMLERTFGLRVPNDDHAIEALVEAGCYLVGNSQTVAEQIEEFYLAAGGFGTLLLVTGKSWTTRSNRERSMRRFIAEVAPRIRELPPCPVDLGGMQSTHTPRMS